MSLQGRCLGVGLVVGFVAAVGCGDDSESTAPTTTTTATSVSSTSSTGGGGSGGSGSGGTPDVTPCGPPATPTATDCPSACTGGCSDGTCLILCDGEQSCNFPLQCPPGLNCQVTCTGGASCRVEVHCDDYYTCDVSCTGAQSCKGVDVICGTVGRCSMVCGNDPETCQGAQLSCGDGECTANCFAPAASPMVDCANSCDCTTCM